MLEHIKKRYSDIQERSFKTKLEVFLLDRVLRLSHVNEITPEEFNEFKITDDKADQYSKAWQLNETEEYIEGSLIIQQIDAFIEHWYKEENKLKDELLEQYKALFVKEYFPFNEFKKLFPIDPKKRVCHYCNISDYDISILREKRKIFTKRQRGYMMEVDRLKANYEYSKDNCVLACYWCNNAKTDEFSFDEFSKLIGPSIKSVWKERD